MQRKCRDASYSRDVRPARRPRRACEASLDRLRRQHAVACDRRLLFCPIGERIERGRRAVRLAALVREQLGALLDVRLRSAVPLLALRVGCAVAGRPSVPVNEKRATGGERSAVDGDGRRWGACTESGRGRGRNPKHSEAVRNSRKQSEAIRSNPKQSEAIYAHSVESKTQSEAIRSNQNSSARTASRRRRCSQRRRGIRRRTRSRRWAPARRDRKQSEAIRSNQKRSEAEAGHQ